MDDLTTRLLSYAWEAARSDFSYETGNDCASGFVAGWVIDHTGKDPAATWRGHYRTALGCRRLLHKSGGLVAMMDKGLGGVGMARTEKPALGDVGAVMMHTEFGEEPVAAIMGPDGWLSLTGRGIRSTAAVRFVAAWSLPRE